LFFHMSPNFSSKFTSQTNPPESSTMSQEERHEMFHQIEKVEKNMENKMNQNWEHMCKVQYLF
jgi:hypothetical protein